MKTMGRTAALLCLAASSLLFGQIMVRGVVRDSAGTPLSDVRVTVTSPSGATFNATTDATGAFQFTDLTVGPGYFVTVEKSGYTTSKSAAVEIRQGQVAIVDFPMSATTTVVASQGPVEVLAAVKDIDDRTTNIGARNGEALYKQIPLERGIPGVVIITPGAVDSNLGGRFNPSISGTNGLENRYTINGIDVTDPGTRRFGAAGPQLNAPNRAVDFESVEEVTVQTGGADAKYGQAMGGFLSTTTKAGGNQYHGSLFGYFDPRALQAGRQSAFTVTPMTRLDAQETWDFGGEMGGYLIKNKLFWHGGFNPVLGRQYLSAPPGFANNRLFQRYVSRNTAYNYEGKLSWNFLPNHQLTGEIFGDPSHTPMGFSRFNSLTANNDAMASSFNYGSRAWMGRYTGVSRSWVGSVQYSQYRSEFRETPRFTNGFQVIDLVGLQNGTAGELFMGGLGALNNTGSGNKEVNAASSHIVNLGRFGQNTVEYGYEYQHSTFNVVRQFTGGAFQIPGLAAFGPAAGQIEQAILVRTRMDPNNPNSPAVLQIAGGSFSRPNVNTDGQYHGAFLQDTLNVSRYVAIKAGIRFEQQRVESGPNHYTFKHDWAPRLGIMIDPFGNRVTKLFGSVGRYYQRVPLGLIADLYGFPSAVVGARFQDQPLGSIALNTSTLIPGGPLAFAGAPGFTPFINSGTKLPYQDEIVVGYEQELHHGFTFSGRLLYNTLERVVAPVSGISITQALAGMPQRFVLANPSNKLDIFGAGASFGANGLPEGYPNPSRVYRAMELVLRKRFGTNWQMFANYRLSKLWGTYDGTFGPYSFVNSDNRLGTIGQAGYLPDDRTNVLRVYSMFRIPTGMLSNWNFGVGLNAQSGTPISQYVADPVFGTPGFIPAGTRGSFGRTPWTYPIDLHADYTHRLTESVNFKFIADLFNIANQSEVLRQNQNLQLFGGVRNPDFGRPDMLNFVYPYQNPFEVRFGIRVEF